MSMNIAGSRFTPPTTQVKANNSQRSGNGLNEAEEAILRDLTQTVTGFNQRTQELLEKRMKLISEVRATSISEQVRDQIKLELATLQQELSNIKEEVTPLARQQVDLSNKKLGINNPGGSK